MAYRIINGNRLFHTDEGGDDGGETLLLIHGGTCDSHDWSAQIGPFAARHRVIVPDLRGHGRSAEAAGGYRPQDFAADLAVLIDKVDAGPVVAVGHSLGGTVASVLAVESPDMVRAVVAVNPSYGFEAAFATEAAAAFRTPDPVGVATAFLGAMEGKDHGPSADLLPVWHRRRALGMPPEALREIFLGLFETAAGMTVRPAAEEYLARRACPVLSVSAGASLKARGVDEHWDVSVSPHPYSRSVVLDGVGHWLFQESSAEFNALVLGWVAGLSTAERSAA